MSLPDNIRAAAVTMNWARTKYIGHAPCFHLCDDGSFCGLSQSWEGHHHMTYRADHPFVSLEDLLRSVAEPQNQPQI